MSEDKIQQEIVTWFTNNFCLKHHSPRSIILSIPNGGFRNKIEAMKLKATGLLPGASDLIIIHKGKIYFIELKDEKGTQQPNQKDFEKRVNDQGYDYLIFRDLLGFQNFILSLP